MRAWIAVTVAIAAASHLCATSPAAAQSPPTVSHDFEAAAAGAAAPGFESALTGGGGAVSWIVVRDATAPAGPNVLAQTSADATDNRFPLAIVQGFAARDVAVSVRFKAVSGRVDRAAGIAVRLRDPGNYYVARANALEDNVRLYRVVAGRRTQIAGADIRVPAGQWQTLGLSAEGDLLTVTFNGAKLFEARDRTFAEAGRVGLWTKADSVTYFDDFAARALR